MRHLLFEEKHYFCVMENLIVIMTITESILLIIGLTIVTVGIILGYAMTHEYRRYLDDHVGAHYNFSDFIRRERFYLYLYLAFIFIMLQNLWLLFE